MKIKKNQLIALIKEETEKIQRERLLEAEKANILGKLKELDESYLGEESLEEVSPDEAIHQDAIKFLSQDPNAEKVKKLYAAYKGGDAAAGKKLIPWLLNHAMKNLGKNKEAASDFIKDVSRVIDGELGRKVNAAGGVSGGLGI